MGKLLPDGCSDRRGDSTTQTIRFTSLKATALLDGLRLASKLNVHDTALLQAAKRLLQVLILS